MADKEKVIIELGFDINDTELNKSQSKIITKSKTTGKKAGDGFSNSFEKASSGFADRIKNGLGVGLGIGAFNAVISGFRAIGRAASEAITEVRDFGRGVAEINSILPENSKLTGEATQQLINFSAQFASDPQRQAKAFYNIVSAGVQGTAKQLETLKVANKTAVAGLVDIDSAAKVLVSSVNSYEASGLTAERASDILFSTVKAGITTFGELQGSIGTVAPIAEAAGVSFEALNAGIASITKSGVATTEAVTGMRAILSSVIKPAEQVSAFAKKIGLDFSVAAIEGKGFSGFLEDIRNKTGGTTVALGKLFPNLRALPAIIRLTGSGFNDFNKILTDTENSAGATDEAFKILSNTSDFQLAKAARNIKNLFLDPLRSFAPAIVEIAKSFNSLFGDANTDAKAKTAAERVTLLTSEIKKLQIQEQSLSQTANISYFGTKNQSQQKLELIQTEIEKKREQLVVDRQLLAVEKEKAATEAAKLTIEPPTELGFGAGVSSFMEGFSPAKTQYANESDEILAKNEKLKKSFTSLGKTSKKMLVDGIGKSVSSGFAAFGAALVNGENAMAAFAKAMIASIGATLVQLGTSFILKGIAYSFDPLLGPAVGGPMIAAGAAMATAGGVMGALGGASTGSATGSVGSTDYDTTSDDQLTQLDDVELEERGTSVVLNISGNILDGDESGLRIVELINQATDSENVTIRRNAVA